MQAAAPKVFGLCEGALATVARTVQAGERRLQLADDQPRQFRQVWALSDPRQEFRLTVEIAPASSASALLRLELAVVRASRLRRLVLWLLAPLAAQRLRQQARQLKSLAEGAPPPGTLWRRAPGAYRGLSESSAPGLHAAAAELVHQAGLDRHGPVLDLGAGTGAWLARLRDAGHARLQAVELHADGFGLDGVTPLQLDLNRPFAAQFGTTRFTLVSALEIVEHLDSPRAFLREVHALLAEGGHAVVSMPNIAHWRGRLRFLWRGEHRYFGLGDYAQRHISPMTDLHMRLMFREVGLKPVAHCTAGSFDGPLRAAVMAPGAVLARALLGPRADGDVSVYLLSRTEPDLSCLGAESDYLRPRAAAPVAGAAPSAAVAAGAAR